MIVIAGNATARDNPQACEPIQPGFATIGFGADQVPRPYPHLRMRISTWIRPIFAPMEDLDLSRSLRRLNRTVDMLQTDLRRGHLNAKLLAEIEMRMEHGIATEPRCDDLPALVDALRESTLTPRRELYADTIRACERLKDAIENDLRTLG